MDYDELEICVSIKICDIYIYMNFVKFHNNLISYGLIHQVRKRVDLREIWQSPQSREISLRNTFLVFSNYLKNKILYKYLLFLKLFEY